MPLGLSGAVIGAHPVGTKPRSVQRRASTWSVVPLSHSSCPSPSRSRSNRHCNDTIGDSTWRSRRGSMDTIVARLLAGSLDGLQPPKFKRKSRAPFMSMSAEQRISCNWVVFSNGISSDGELRSPDALPQYAITPAGRDDRHLSPRWHSTAARTSPNPSPLKSPAITELYIAEPTAPKSSSASCGLAVILPACPKYTTR